MALGNGNTYQHDNNQNSNNTNKSGSTFQHATFYSRLRFFNSDAIGMSFSYWNGLLRISMNEYKDNKTTDLETITLSPTKAKMLSIGVKKILEDEDCPGIFGMDSGSGETRNLIMIGRENKVAYVIMGKVTVNGQFDGPTHRFNFSKNFNYVLNFTSNDSLEYQKTYDNNIEIEQFLNILEDFARSSNGAYGYTNNDINRYEAAKLSNLIRGGSSNNSRNDNYFSRNDNRSYAGNSSDKDNSSKKIVYKNIDDIESEFD